MKALVLQGLACATAVVVASAGCGESDPRRSEQPPTATRAQPPAESPSGQPATGAGSGSAAVDALERRLEAAGYAVVETRVEGVRPAAQAALEFPLKRGGQITVYAYSDSGDAAEKAAEFRPHARRHPDNFRVAVVGTTAYVGTADPPETLDRSEFDAAVVTAARD